MPLAVGIGIGIGIAGGLFLAWRSWRNDIALDRKISDKLDELPPLFEYAENAIKIATDFDPKFFEEEKVKCAIEKALENGAEVKFLTDEEIPTWYSNHAKIETKRVKKLQRHIMVVDDRHTRLERPHKPCRFGERRFDIALIFKDFPQLAGKIDREFDRLWMTSS